MEKKDLYNKIMGAVSKEVKKSLDESLRYNYDENVEYVAIEFHGDWHLFHYETMEDVIRAYDIENPDNLMDLKRLQRWESLHVVLGDDEDWATEDVVIIKV